MPKKMARRALGARRADGRSIASKMMVSTDTLRVQARGDPARGEPSQRTVWLGLKNKKSRWTKTEMNAKETKTEMKAVQRAACTDLDGYSRRV